MGKRSYLIVKLLVVPGITVLAGRLAYTEPVKTKATTAAVHPIIDAQWGYLLGGSGGGKWVQAATIARSMRGGEKYQVYNLGGLRGQGTGSKPESFDAPCPETLMVKVPPFRAAPVMGSRPYKPAGFAIRGGWNAMPRKPRLMSVTQAVYRKAVTDVLRQHGLRRPNVKIEQIVRVDLNGDGSDEVLISATHYAGEPAAPNKVSPNTTAGDYSFVMLRRVVRGKVQTQVLIGEFYPKAKTFNAPNHHNIAGILDVNGDGRMEILLHGEYYEGGWTSVYSQVGSQYEEVLSAGCGA